MVANISDLCLTFQMTLSGATWQGCCESPGDGLASYSYYCADASYSGVTSGHVKLSAVADGLLGTRNILESRQQP